MTITISLTDTLYSGIYSIFRKCFTADPSAPRLKTMLVCVKGVKKLSYNQ